MRGHFRRERGAHMVEFALIFPVFWLMLAGAIDLGWLFYHQSMLDRATAVGCRAGALIDPGLAENDISYVRAETEARVVEELELNPGVTCAGVCSVSVDTFGQPPGRSLKCDVNYFFTPVAGVAVGELTLQSTMVVRMEWQRW